MYLSHRCRCPECRAAYSSHRRGAEERGGYIDAALLRRAVMRLSAAGLSVDTIAAKAGVSRYVVTSALYGTKATKARATTYRAVIGVEVPEIIPVSHARSLLRSLHWYGWSATALAKVAGLHANTIRNVLPDSGWVHPATVRQIVDRCARLDGVFAPETTTAERRSAGIARKRARENGWPLPAREGRQAA